MLAKKMTVVVAALMMAAASAQAAVVTQVQFRMGEDGSWGSNLNPLSSTNGYYLGESWDGGPASWTTNVKYYHLTGQGGWYGYSDSGINYDPGVDNSQTAHIFGTGDSGYGVSIWFRDGGFEARMDDLTVGGNVYTNTVSSDWVDLALVRDNGTTTFYVNGLAYGSTSVSAPTDSGTYHQMSVKGGGGAMFTGDVDEARISTFDANHFLTSDLQMVPEPSTFSLLGLAILGGLTALRRRLAAKV